MTNVTPIPNDVAINKDDSTERLDKVDEDRNSEVEKKKGSLCWRICGILFLSCCVLGGSLIGPVSNIVAPESVLIKNIWRCGVLVIYLFIPSLIEFKYKKKADYASFFTCKQYGLFTVAYICHALWGLGIVYGGVMLIQSHAYILNTSVGSFMLIFSYITCTKPILIELVAFFIVLIGQIIMMADPHAEREDGK